MSPTVSRNSVALAGAGGLVPAALILAGGFFAAQAWIPAPLLPQIWAGWGLFALFGAISLAEIPVMIFGLRKLAAGHGSAAQWGALGGVAVFVLFAAVYALPNLLLGAKSLRWMGVAIGAGSVLRYIAAVMFVPKAQNADGANWTGDNF